MPTRELLILDRPPPALGQLLKRSPRLSPEHHWEGEFAGAHGSTKSCTLRIKAQIAFRGELVEGKGRCVNMPADTFGDDTFTLSGTLGAGGLSFHVDFAVAPIGTVPVVADGALSADERTMTGDWSIACIFPDTCDCQGGGGTFELRRVH
jgi:hypothetical protein